MQLSLTILHTQHGHRDHPIAEGSGASQPQALLAWLLAPRS